MTGTQRLIVALCVFAFAEACFITVLLVDRGRNLDSISESKGRVEILEQEVAKKTIEIDSAKIQLKNLEAKIDCTKTHEVIITQYYEKKSNHIANLPLDSAVILLGAKLSQSQRHK